MINYAKDYSIKKMKKCFNIFLKKIDSIRVGSANVMLLSNISLIYYGKKVLLNKISRITVYNTKTLRISAFDKSINNIIIQSILKSNIDVNPYTKDNDVFVTVPLITSEKRTKFIKLIYKEGEIAKVNIRIVRRDVNTKFNNMYLKKNIDKDSKYKIEKIVQNITNDFITKIDKALYLKENYLKNN
ncbi:ribosome recycling factor [Buchnera aphidicola]|uniref:ribosome recycling factor n=1 Tax=Buchnera aphidicola TaxID=9 RepID=UPI0031B88DD6